VRRVICIAAAALLAPIALARRCHQCWQRRIRAVVAPHRDGRLGVFWVCESCGAKFHAW
jgi:hypothetical protein